MKSNMVKGSMTNKEQQIWTGRDKDGNAFRLNAPLNAGSGWVFGEAARLLALLGWAKVSVVMKGDHVVLPTSSVKADPASPPFLNPDGFAL